MAEIVVIISLMILLLLFVYLIFRRIIYPIFSQGKHQINRLEEEYHDKLNILVGRGICTTCNKKLTRVYQVKGHRNYYCLEHAIERYHIIQEVLKTIGTKKDSPNHSRSENDISEEKIIKCDTCEKELHVLNKFKCSYCSNYHCEEHRLPSSHECKKPTKPKGMTGSPIVYGRKSRPRN